MSGSLVVSVVIPVRDLRTYLPEAIESVLAQTVPAETVEVIVVDDGSTDGSGEVAERYAPRVRVLRQPSRGLPAARNAGIDAASAPYLQFLDADDRLLPEKLEASLAVFAADPGVGLVYSGCRFIDERGAPLPQEGWSREEGDVLSRLVLGNLINPHMALVRRDHVVRAGGFDEGLTSLEDWDLWLRLARQGVRWRCVDRALVEYRVRAGAMHQNVERMLENRLRVLDKLYADDGLPEPVRRLRPQAYQNAWLAAACQHYVRGDRTAGGATFGKAVGCRPEMLAEPETLRRVCRWFLPLGRQREAGVVARRRESLALLQAMLDDLFATPVLDPAIAAQRDPSRRAVRRVAAHLARKRVRTVLRRSRRKAK